MKLVLKYIYVLDSLFSLIRVDVIFSCFQFGAEELDKRVTEFQYVVEKVLSVYKNVSEDRSVRKCSKRNSKMNKMDFVI